MTKKDYVSIAKIIKSEDFTSLDGDYNKKKLAESLAREFKKDNDRFDTEKFLTACGVTK